MTDNGVFCLEGEWSPDLRKRRSVLPMLELLESLGEIKFIHRDVAAFAEVDRYLDTWQQRRYDEYRVLYLVAHGDKGGILWSQRNWSDLEEVGAALEGVAKGCYIYFGSCLTLFDGPSVQRFAEQTGARGVLGYRRSVDWLESAAFDILLLPLIANGSRRPATLFNQVMKRHGQLAKNLKFVMASGSGAWRAQDGPISKG